ncbi:pirin family protein [Simiduia sp. 21SJ11W-1]|uniref:pirin family protein n=1 Tax=Simiduia sp. 21SJ11W-1 TaxID=2909669 RepID=UPI00209CB994|nr:pirin family protein [Simiduia sp. 21SJ11W-1]UTA48909.1 pirin family protein [Simiduia sp. 21SJ11W-1]
MKRIVKTLAALPTKDGAGVSLYRSLGTHLLPELNPFLMLDEIRADEAADYLAGFPSHPHRGFETVTIMLEGKMRHKDSRGNEGVIESGGVQWMTAGSGIIHSEMPEQTEGKLWGFQLWVNLPAANKMMTPRYQDIPAKEIPTAIVDGAKVRVMAGTVGTTTGPVKDIVTRPSLLDVHLDGTTTLALPPRTLLYVYEGSITIGGKAVNEQHLAVLSDEPELSVTGKARFLVFGAEPMAEPIARHGPFVMNTREQLMAAFEDYQTGKFG